MSEMGEVFQSLRQERRQSRSEAARTSLEALGASGLPFDLKNNGTHIVIAGVDFWPASGLWICRRNPKRRHGVEDLINYVRKKGIS